MAPPNTKANSSTNMIGWSVTSSSFSGIWRMCSTLRRANTMRVAPQQWPTPAAPRRREAVERGAVEGDAVMRDTSWSVAVVGIDASVLDGR